MFTLFNIFTISTGDETPSRLYPIAGSQTDTVLSEPDDGAAREYRMTSLRSVRRARRGVEQAFEVKNIEATLAVTDSRIVIACSAYDKGGGWVGFGVGGLAVAVVANAVSRARATRRRQDTMLVGHVRYEWLRQIHGTDRAALGRNILSCIVQDPTGGIVDVSFVLERTQPATDLASEIARRAAKYPYARSLRRTSYDAREVEYWLSGGELQNTASSAAGTQADQARRRRQTTLLLLQ